MAVARGSLSPKEQGLFEPRSTKILLDYFKIRQTDRVISALAKTGWWHHHHPALKVTPLGLSLFGVNLAPAVGGD